MKRIIFAFFVILFLANSISAFAMVHNVDGMDGNMTIHKSEMENMAEPCMDMNMSHCDGSCLCLHMTVKVYLEPLLLSMNIASIASALYNLDNADFTNAHSNLLKPPPRF